MLLFVEHVGVVVVVGEQGSDDVLPRFGNGIGRRWGGVGFILLKS